MGMHVHTAVRAAAYARTQTDAVALKAESSCPVGQLRRSINHGFACEANIGIGLI